VARGRLLIGEPTPFTAPPYGLLSTATELSISEGHWKMGIEWEPLCPDAAGTADPCTVLVDDSGVATPPDDPSTVVVPKTPTTDWEIQGATPFTAYAEIECSPVGTWDQLSDRTRRALQQAEERFVESVFWTGVATDATPPTETVFPHLAADGDVVDGRTLLQPAAQVVTTEPQPIEVGIGMLEDAARDCYPGQVTLHAPLRLGSLLASADNIVTRGGVAQTVIGSNIVLGSGYTGSASDGAVTQGTTWMYATGPVFYMRDPMVQFRLRESIDRTVNTVTVITERTYVVGFSCCLLAIPIENGEVTAA